MSFRPSSIFLAMTISPSRVSSSTVDGDDALGLGLLCILDDGQADATQPEGGHRVASLHLGRVVHGADAGGDAAAQQTDVFGISLRR